MESSFSQQSLKRCCQGGREADKIDATYHLLGSGNLTTQPPPKFIQLKIIRPINIVIYNRI